MMQEILSLLVAPDTQNADASERQDEQDVAQTDIPPDVLGDCEPLPFPADADAINEPSQNEFADLRKRTRLKLSSRRYTRRRKEESKLQASTLRQHQKELCHLNELVGLLNHGGRPVEEQQQVASQLQREHDVLLNEIQSSASHTFKLAQRVVTSTPSTKRELVEDATRNDDLAAVQPVAASLSPMSQLKKGIINVRTIINVLSARREKSPELWLNVFRGWRLVECRRRGSRFAVLASKKIPGVSQDELGHRVWQYADDPIKRLSMNLFYSKFAPVTSTKTQLEDSSSIFYSEELHEFPHPFLCRSFTSIHGAKNDDDKGDFIYVKQSLNELKPHQESIWGAEIFGVVIQDAASDDGQACVDVDLVMLYDTRAVCHVEELVCEEPLLCHRVITRWERTHLVADSGGDR